ncbi:MAG: hypothetical protein KDD11_15050 [Acidobacteria bacterium]|nr:hypothetical protein [Acidobacteriota bacterium]
MSSWEGSSAAREGGHGGSVRGDGGPPTPTFGEEIEDLYTLSPMQQGMLFHVLAAPDDRLYLDQTLCTLRGELDLDAFRAAWNTVVERHPALRTAFVWRGLRKPLQVVHREAQVEIEAFDWRQLSPKVQKSQLEAFLREDRQRGFDLAEAPLMRVHVIRMGDRVYRMLWTVYHLVVDAWCSAIVLGEVSRCYEALRARRQPQLPPARPYRDFIAWLKTRELEAAESFWRGYLRGFRRPTPLARDSDTEGLLGLGSGHRHEHLELSEEQTRGLQRLAREQHLTLGTLIQGAWGMLLAHRSGEDDVVFGTTVSGRTADLAGAAEIVGPFINTLPHRLRVDREARAARWLQEVQDRQLEVRELEHTPLHRIQGWSEVAGSASLFHSIVVFVNITTITNMDRGSLYIQDLRYIGRPHLPLTLNVIPGAKLEIEMVYEVRCFRWAEVRHLLDQMEALLAALVAEPGATVGELLEAVQRVEDERRTDERRRRRDTNSGMLRITRPVAVKIHDPKK